MQRSWNVMVVGRRSEVEVTELVVELLEWFRCPYRRRITETRARSNDLLQLSPALSSPQSAEGEQPFLKPAPRTGRHFCSLL